MRDYGADFDQRDVASLARALPVIHTAPGVLRRSARGDHRRNHFRAGVEAEPRARQHGLKRRASTAIIEQKEQPIPSAGPEGRGCDRDESAAPRLSRVAHQPSRGRHTCCSDTGELRVGHLAPVMVPALIPRGVRGGGDDRVIIRQCDSSDPSNRAADHRGIRGCPRGAARAVVEMRGTGGVRRGQLRCWRTCVAALAGHLQPVIELNVPRRLAPGQETW